MDTNAVQRHRAIILDCLRDGDISIRRRALELSFALINESNVRVLTRELLSFLEVADAEFKLSMTTQICLAAERYAPNRRWHIDTVLRVLKLAGNSVREEVLSSFIRLVCHTPELQAYTVQRLYANLRQDVSQESLTLAGVWTIGEFGDVLLQGGNFEEEDLVREVKDSDILDLLESVLASPYVNALIRQYVVTAATKLATRLPQSDAAQQGRLRALLHVYDASVELELQQRAVEYGELLAQYSNLAEGVLERMPPPELRATVMGTVSEKRAVGSTRKDKDVRRSIDRSADDCRRCSTSWARSRRPCPPRPRQRRARRRRTCWPTFSAQAMRRQHRPPPRPPPRPCRDRSTTLWACSAPPHRLQRRRRHRDQPPRPAASRTRRTMRTGCASPSCRSRTRRTPVWST